MANSVVASSAGGAATPKLPQGNGFASPPVTARVGPGRHNVRLWTSAALLLLGWVLAGCSSALTPQPTPADLGQAGPAASGAALYGGAAEAVAGLGKGKDPAVSLTLTAKGVKLEPLPLRAGFPFTITIPIHNNDPVPVVDVPVMVYLSAVQEEIGFRPFFRVLTVTVPATQTLAVKVPVVQNLAGGEYQLWVQVNRLSAPLALQAGTPTLPEANIDDNAALLDVVIAPFDAYLSDLCPGRLDVALEVGDIWLEPDLQRIHVRVHNVGNQAVYNLPVVVVGGQGDHEQAAQATGVAYTPAIPPCGGTALVVVALDRPLEPGESVDLAVNPGDWPDALAEDSFDNNTVRSLTVSPGSADAGQAPSLVSEAGQAVATPAAGVTDYDFAVSPADVEIVRSGIILVKVYNLGTRDVANLPIRIEGKAGRKVTDVIPLIEGNGLGVAAIQLGWLWSPKATLTLIVNPEGAKGGYPETSRDNNVVTFTLP